MVSKISANQGNRKGQHSYGVCLLRGIGIKKNESEALKWFLKAADEGYSTVQYNVAYCLENGISTTKDIEAARQYYQKAADQGLDKARRA